MFDIQIKILNELSNENIIFFYDVFINYIDVCLQSLRKYNSTCNIYFL